MTISIVTGLGYGDEGKGTTVDYLAWKSIERAGGQAVVVRHNGGPQAGHNVVSADDRQHHEFSQFGSGTFAGAQTFLSRFMLINPLDMIREAEHLESLGLLDSWEGLTIDVDAKIITPYHVALNRLFSYARGESCGRGVGEAMRQDIERPDLTIRVRDVMLTNLASSSLVRKLEDLREYLRKFSYRVTPGWSSSAPEAVLLRDSSFAEHLAQQYWEWRARGWLVPLTNGDKWLYEQTQNGRDIIFEGAQGVLLDEWRGFHPYTTWSTTTPHNARILLNTAGYDGPVDELGVTRAYATRHGAGPFVTEDPTVHYDEPHNVTGTYQGDFRTGSLDLLALRYAISACNRQNSMKLVVTHLDRAKEWNVVSRYTHDGFTISNILLNPDLRDLAHQERITQALMKTQPAYSGPVSTNGLLAMLNKIAPVAIESWGPTHQDKRVTTQEEVHV